MNNQPPKLLLRFFRWFCHPRLQKPIEGDLMELYDERVKELGKGKADQKFRQDVIQLFRPGIIKPADGTYRLTNYGMLKNYFKIVYRNMFRYKFFTLINVLGLSMGIAMSLFIAVHLSNELSYETGFPKHRQIYRLASTKWAKMPPLLATEFKSKIPEVKDIGRLFAYSSGAFTHEKNQILIEHPYIGDPSILAIFDAQIVEGDLDPLAGPSTIVLTESTARRIFKTGDSRIGEKITFAGNSFIVSGIMKDFPKKSHLKIDCIISSNDSFIVKNTSRGWQGVSIYALFDSENEVIMAESKLLDFQIDFQSELFTEEEIMEENDLFELHPIVDIHLHSHREKETEKNSSITFVYIFFSLAIFILLVAVINFVNLYIAQTLNRLKEIGLRKVMGAYRSQLILQFLTEAFVLVIVSSLLALLLTYLVLPYYNDLAEIQLQARELFSPKLMLFLTGLVLIVGFAAGGYPAFYLSKFGIDQGLKTKFLKIDGRLPLRTAMVAFQFFISVGLLTATLIVSRQIDFIETKELGFAQEEVVAVKLLAGLWWQTTQHPEKVRNELLKHADVASVSISSTLLGDRFGIEPFAMADTPENEVDARYITADKWFTETLGLELSEGNFANKSFTGNQFIINRKAASELQNDNLIGKIGLNSFQKTNGKIVGIVDDFHFASLHNQIDPLVIHVSENERNFANYLLIRVKSVDLKATLFKIESTLSAIAPGTLIVSSIMDDRAKQLYSTENSMFKVFKVFSTTIICLACLGLFALFAFVAQARTKELGIRKTLGASTGRLLALMTKSYVVLLVLIIFITVPFTKFFATSWLSNFAFKTTTQWWYFVLPGILVLGLAVLAIFFQSWKVAAKNPVDSLKDE